VPMHPSAILHEAQQLYKVIDRLDLLAGQYPLVAEAPITISGSVHNTATLLEVVVATKMGPLSGLDSSKCLICSSPSSSCALGFRRASYS